MLIWWFLCHWILFDTNLSAYNGEFASIKSYSSVVIYHANSKPIWWSNMELQLVHITCAWYYWIDWGLVVTNDVSETALQDLDTWQFCGELMVVVASCLFVLSMLCCITVELDVCRDDICVAGVVFMMLSVEHLSWIALHNCSNISFIKISTRPALIVIVFVVW